MGFPLSSRARYSYVNDFFVNRLGIVRWYNHANALRPDGSLRRAHDGIDIHVALGTAVLSPFTGRIVDPATLWRPWDAARYGVTGVVISEEPTSRGYAALLVHLAKLEVAVGERVKRGQRLGTVGNTGNAAGEPDHLHFELRAPFPLTVDEAGRIRRLDAFDPYPSLVAADPHQD
jgi:murein DD-endopeptidase MepM/ murein hydrolase activator NlpD